MKRIILNITCLCTALASLVGFGLADAVLQAAEVAEQRQMTTERIRADINYLASDSLEGRGVLTEGNEKAAAHLQQSFQESGLEPVLPDASFYQGFSISLGSELNSEKSRLLFVASDETHTLSLGKSYQPLAAGIAGSARSEIVFAGYGISAPNENYDDYAGVDVKGKIVLILRMEPQNTRADGAFEGTETSEHAFISTKLQVAAKQGAAAVLFVNDQTTVANANQQDELANVDAFGAGLERIPFAQITRAAVDYFLARAPLQAGGQSFGSLARIEEQIDRTLKPITQPIDKLTVDFDFVFEAKSVEVANVIGLVPGERADEYVVIGAHFDHIGYGEVGSRKPGVHEIHNGADDNASGSALVMELARRFAAGPKPKRSLLFIGFNGEERGLLGSNHYVENPAVPLEKTVAMVNFDMVGSWDENPLTVYGLATAKEFDSFLTPALRAEGSEVNPVGNILSASDHYGFYRHKIPVLHFFTGLTEQYHTPEDDIALVNMEGIARVTDLAEQVVVKLLNRTEPLTFAEVEIESPGRGSMAYLGVIPDYASGAGGLKINGTSPNSPAEAAGFQAGDVITHFGDVAVNGIEGLTRALRRYKPDETIEVRYQRAGVAQARKVTLGAPRRGN